MDSTCDNLWIAVGVDCKSEGGVMIVRDDFMDYMLLLDDEEDEPKPSKKPAAVAYRHC